MPWRESSTVELVHLTAAPILIRWVMSALSMASVSTQIEKGALGALPAL